MMKGDFSFSRPELEELKNAFNKNYIKTTAIFNSIKDDFENIRSKWQGGDSEKVIEIFTKISNSLDSIENNLGRANQFIGKKSDDFNSVHFTI